MEALAEALPLLMFAGLAIFLFSGYPVAFVLGGIGLAFALITIQVDDFLFSWDQFGAIPSRIYGNISVSLILTAIPMFIFMGTMLERSGIARDLLNCLQVLLRRVPGGLALAVTLMGTILAATTGIIGASVVMMSLLALPVMMARNYSHSLASGTIAASGTLGILIPPSIMLVIMADLLSRSVGNLFVAAVIPGFMLSGLYVLYIILRTKITPSMAPPLPRNVGPQTRGGIWMMVLRSFVPPIILIGLVLGSILAGYATPTEAAGVGAAGAIMLGLLNLVLVPSIGFIWVAPFYAGISGLAISAALFAIIGQFGLWPFATGMSSVVVGLLATAYGFIRALQDWKSGADPHRFDDIDFSAEGETKLEDGPGDQNSWSYFWSTLKDVTYRTALTNAMIFGIFIGATLFSFVFRAIGGEELVIHLVESMGLGSWGLLFLILGIVFFLGFFFDWIEITLIVLPVFSPIIELLDFGAHVDKVEIVYWFAILLAVNLQTSFLTPPFGFALFYLKAVAPPEIKIQAIYRGIIPFVMLQLGGLGLVLTFPELALWLPRVLLD
jgi:TRAP-type mannitol/chloroaromatic compound transport system permease large subunit